MSTLTKTFIVCDICGAKACGHETTTGTGSKKRARDELKKKGWKYIVQCRLPASKQNPRDLCPLCAMHKRA